MHDQILSTTFKVYDNSDELTATELKLYQMALKARDKAYAPYSGFSVGASVLLDDNSVFTGNNQENAAYPSGICAERVAIWAAMSMLPNARIQKLFITARSEKSSVQVPVAPCGACRQTIAEYETKQKKSIEIFFTGESGPIVKAQSIKDLLPWMFDNTKLL